MVNEIHRESITKNIEKGHQHMKPTFVLLFFFIFSCENIKNSFSFVSGDEKISIKHKSVAVNLESYTNEDGILSTKFSADSKVTQVLETEDGIKTSLPPGALAFNTELEVDTNTSDMHAKYIQAEKDFKEELLIYRDKIKSNEETIHKLGENNNLLKFELDKANRNYTLLQTDKLSDNEIFLQINDMKEKYEKREV